MGLISNTIRQHSPPTNIFPQREKMYCLTCVPTKTGKPRPADESVPGLVRVFTVNLKKSRNLPIHSAPSNDRLDCADANVEAELSLCWAHISEHGRYNVVRLKNGLICLQSTHVKIYYKRTVPCGNFFPGICGQRMPRSPMQSGQGIRCLQKEPLDNIECFK